MKTKLILILLGLGLCLWQLTSIAIAKIGSWNDPGVQEIFQRYPGHHQRLGWDCVDISAKEVNDFQGAYVPFKVSSKIKICHDTNFGTACVYLGRWRVYDPNNYRDWPDRCSIAENVTLGVSPEDTGYYYSK